MASMTTAVPRDTSSTQSARASGSSTILEAAEGMRMPMQASMSSEEQARLDTALKVCTLWYMPPRKKLMPAIGDECLA